MFRIWLDGFKIILYFFPTESPEKQALLAEVLRIEIQQTTPFERADALYRLY